MVQPSDDQKDCKLKEFAGKSAVQAMQQFSRRKPTFVFLRLVDPFLRRAVLFCPTTSIAIAGQSSMVNLAADFNLRFCSRGHAEKE
jgi:hypothetical protein